MVEEMEKAQKELRDMDYDTEDDDDDNDNDTTLGSRRKNLSSSSAHSRKSDHPAAHLPSPKVTNESASRLEQFLDSEDRNTDDDNVLLIDTSSFPPAAQATESNLPNSTLIKAATTTATDTFAPTTSASVAPVSSNTVTATLPSEWTTTTTPATTTTTTTTIAPFSSLPSTKIHAANSLFDDDDDTATVEFSVELQTIRKDDDDDLAKANDRTPGTAGYLEMEKEPPRTVYEPQPQHHRDETLTAWNEMESGEPIRTDSGLNLTHRKVAATRTPGRPSSTVFRDTQHDYFEVEKGVFRGWNKENPNISRRDTQNHKNYFGAGGKGFFGRSNNNNKHSMVVVQAKRLFSYVQIWVLLFSLVVLSMTGVFFHSMGSEPETSVAKESSAGNTAIDALPDKILLLPLPGIAEASSRSIQHLEQQQQQQQTDQQNQPRRLRVLPETDERGFTKLVPQRRDVLGDLRRDFEAWVLHHGKAYASHEEKERRFSIWSQNHQRTAEKNSRHGPCSLTKQQVFGSNHLQDLAPEEFQAKFLTGYKGIHADTLEKKLRRLSPEESKLRTASGIGAVLDPQIHKANIHESVREKQRHLNQKMNSSPAYRPQVMGSPTLNCKWYDLSCVLRYIWMSTGIQFGSFIGTMEPKFDADAFPNSVDWRDSGAVTDVRTQGECGACWAITAVETVESAYFLATGTLYELSESEIIVCDDTCEMCTGGWPQNAYEWVMDHGGLPLRSTLPYDSYTLIALTSALDAESQYYNEATVESYQSEVCPAGDNKDSHSGSNDEAENNNYYANNSNQARYGNIEGYGYATDRCLCYTDGSGCECDDQDEDTAVRNIATYGPAVVCLEASTWQDYNGGIMTNDIGCGQEFLDMNHCVQVVGYAFTDGSSSNDDCRNNQSGDEQEEDQHSGDENDCKNSGSNSNSGDSKDREGYWIVRNQWGESWGMNGYAYVSMGANTCGILNDMTIAYA